MDLTRPTYIRPIICSISCLSLFFSFLIFTYILPRFQNVLIITLRLNQDIVLNKILYQKIMKHLIKFKKIRKIIH